MLAVAAPTASDDWLARTLGLRTTERARRLPSKAPRRLRKAPSLASPTSAPPQRIFLTRIAADCHPMPEGQASHDRHPPNQEQLRGPEKVAGGSGMAGDAQSSSASSHLDPNAFDPSAIPQPHSGFGSGVTRASQGVPSPGEGNDARGGTASDSANGVLDEPEKEQSDQAQHHQPSLFSTATATTPISFSSHPALRPQGLPFRYDAGGGVNPGAGFLAETWPDPLQQFRYPNAAENVFLAEGVDLTAFSELAHFDDLAMPTPPSGLMGYDANTEPSVSGSSTDPSRNNSIVSNTASAGTMPFSDLHPFPPFPLAAQPSGRAADDSSWANGYLPLPVLASLIASANSTLEPFSSSSPSMLPSGSRTATSSAGPVDAGGPSSGSSAPSNTRADSGTSDDRSRSGSGVEASGSRTGRNGSGGNGTSRLPGTGGNGDGSDSDDEGQEDDSGKRKRDPDSAGGKKLVQRADKSCRKCR